MSGYYWARVGGMRMAADLKQMRKAKVLTTEVSEVIREVDPASGESRVAGRRTFLAKTLCAISGADCHRLAMRDA
jgi:hypothetical protein